MTSLSPITVHAYDAITGRHLTRLPYTAASWSESINDPGNMQAEIIMSSLTNQLSAQDSSLYELLRPWKTIISVERTPQVLHAGVVTSRQWDPATRKLTLNAGGGWTLLGKRLVLNHKLDASFRDGEILIDEEHPSADWTLTLNGSYRDIIRGLIAETLKWGLLPFDLPPAEGGSYTRTYYGYDLATIADRLQDLADIENGDEIRFTPHVNTDTGRLSFLVEAEPELVDHKWQWNATIPGQRIMLNAYDEDGSAMTSSVWAAGGKNNDKTLMCRYDLTDTHGWPLMQTANTQHTTVSVLATLQSYAKAQAAYGLSTSETIGLKVGSEYDVHVGDWVDLRIDDDLLGRRQLHLKITDVDGTADSDWLTLQATPRIEA